MSDALAAAAPYLGWAAAFVAALCWRSAARTLQSDALARSQESEQARSEVARLEGEAGRRDAVAENLRRQLHEAQRQLHALTRYNGRRIEHEGQKGHIVSATVLGWYMDRDRPHLTIRTDAAPGRPSISYGVAFDQCRFVDPEPTPALPR